MKVEVLHMTAGSLRREHFAFFVSSLLLAGWNAMNLRHTFWIKKRKPSTENGGAGRLKKYVSLTTLSTIQPMELPIPDFFT